MLLCCFVVSVFLGSLICFLMHACDSVVADRQHDPLPSEIRDVLSWAQSASSNMTSCIYLFAKSLPNALSSTSRVLLFCSCCAQYRWCAARTPARRTSLFPTVMCHLICNSNPRIQSKDAHFVMAELCSKGFDNIALRDFVPKEQAPAEY